MVWMRLVMKALEKLSVASNAADILGRARALSGDTGRVFPAILR
jgi:hypothetical protein